MKQLAASWGRDVKALKRLLHGLQTSLPRGRITHSKAGYVVIQGDDARLVGLGEGPVPLTGVKVTPEFTEHEKMLADDPKAVQAALGIPPT